jgi:hypothetical protein
MLQCTTANYIDPMAGTQTPASPSLMPPSSWRARRAGLISHGARLDDPDVVECDQAMAFWRCRKVIDKERTTLHPDHVATLADMLRHAHPVVPA